MSLALTMKQRSVASMSKTDTALSVTHCLGVEALILRFLNLSS